MKAAVHDSRKHRSLRCAEWTLFILASGALGICAFAYWEATAFQAGARRGLDAAAGISVERRSSALLPKRVTFARIEIPRLTISAMIGEGIDPRTLRWAVGHIPGTALPGEPGNVGLAAHRDLYFRNLRFIRQGDVILVSTPAGESEYSVEWTRIVEPIDIGVLKPTSDQVLTLVTCYPFSYVGSAPQRFIVRARRIPS